MTLNISATTALKSVRMLVTVREAIELTERFEDGIDADDVELAILMLLSDTHKIEDQEQVIYRALKLTEKPRLN